MEAHSANILRKSGRGASREGGICSGRCGAGGRMGAGAACADGLPMVGRSEFSGNGLRWSVGRRPRKRMCGISGGGGCRVADRGLGPVCSWSRQGVGMSGVGRCAADRRCRVVGQQGGCRAGAGRCGPLGAARAGVDSLFRRGRHGAAAVSERGRSHPPDGAPVPAWSLSSGGPGIGSVRTVGSDEGRRGPSVPAGQAWSRRRFRTGRSHPPDARPPIFARSALRKGPDAPFSDSFCPFLQRPAAPEPTPFANPRFRRSGKAKKLFFYFYFIIKDVSLCSQNNT